MNKIVSDTSISKFETEEKVIFAKIQWNQNEHDLFHIKIYDGDKTWTGRFSNAFANQFAENIDITIEEYRANVKEGLSRQSPTYSYEFKPVPEASDTYSFCWFKKFADAVQTYGRVPVHRDNAPESKDTLLEFLLLENNDLRKLIDTLNSKTTVINDDLNRCKNELEKFVNIKTSLETSLYGKFVQLLNAKKRRIQSLEENTSHYQGTTKQLH